MLLGLTIMQWVVILEAAPGIITALEKLAPELANLFKQIQSLSKQLGSPQAAVHLIATNPYASPQEWNSWAAVMRPDLLQSAK